MLLQEHVFQLVAPRIPPGWEDGMAADSQAIADDEDEDDKEDDRALDESHDVPDEEDDSEAEQD